MRLKCIYALLCPTPNNRPIPSYLFVQRHATATYTGDFLVLRIENKDSIKKSRLQKYDSTIDFQYCLHFAHKFFTVLHIKVW
jgi:hypothetical protein